MLVWRLCGRKASTLSQAFEAPPFYSPVAFIYIAHSMMALLYETVPALGDTWVKCPRILSRHAISTQDDDIQPGKTNSRKASKTGRVHSKSLNLT